MALGDKITLEGEHGQYQTYVGRLDTIIARYLPASVVDLQEVIQERQGDPEYRISTVAEGLMILAELDGFATN